MTRVIKRKIFHKSEKMDPDTEMAPMVAALNLLVLALVERKLPKMMTR